MTTVSDNQYLSIGEVLGLLLEDFPDVTISKIRFLESQGLIEPERTPSGYRKFYDHDVDLLRAILHEQKENFLPLKVIRDRIESGTIETDPTGARTPPRGIRNVEVRDTPHPETAQRDSVFRRTDGGPEWADGRALIPGDLPSTASRHPSAGNSTGAVPVTSPTPNSPTPNSPTPNSPTPSSPTPSSPTPSSPTPGAPAASPDPSIAEARPTKRDLADQANATTSTLPGASPSVVSTSAPKAAPVTAAASPARPVSHKVAVTPTGLPYSRDELCLAAGISETQLCQLDEFAIVPSRGSGAQATYQTDALEIARVAGRFLEQGIDARHLRAWRQGAERESALFEQRILPLLRQRNPQSRQLALQALSELADLGSQLRSALVDSLLRHHFDGS